METKTLDIPVILPDYYGDCARCLDRLRDAILELDGVSAVELDLKKLIISLTYDSNMISLDRIEDRARRLGLEISERYIHESLLLEGLDCPDCAMKLEKAVGRMGGVLWSSVNYATSVLAVEYEQEKVGHHEIVNRVQDLGYDVTDVAEVAGVPMAAAPKPIWLNRRVAATAISAVFLAAALIASAFGAGLAVTGPLFGIAIITGGYYPARAGLLSLRALSLDTNMLVVLAAVGAIALGELGEAAGVLFLFSLGSALEAYTVDRTRRSVRSLMDLSPREASVIREGVEQRIPVESVKVGEKVLVRPGERIPMDGVVSGGSSSVDESAITGESVPKEKTIGAAVFAGTINQRGSLEVRVTRLVGDDTLSRVIHLVEEAQAQKAPSQQLSERFGQVYTPIVVGLAIIISLISLFTRNTALFRQALVLLVVACPCALVISTPVAIVSAIGNAAKNGLLVKGGAYLEELGRVSVVALDKTGTLTTGRLEVTDIVPVTGDSAEVLKVAASIESRSEHPLAESILRKAAEEAMQLYSLAYFEAIPGFGAHAIIGTAECHIGNQRLLERLKIAAPDQTVVDSLRKAGKTLMYVIREQTVLGIVAASDTLREGSGAAVLGLKRAGIKKTIMLTGDSAVTARAVAAGLGMDDIEAELLPEDKVERIRTLVSRYGKVAMIGDGINDAPALATATVGVAMGGAGAHAALETADMALMADDLAMLPYAMRLSKATLAIIRQNTFFAMLSVLALVGFTLWGKLPLIGGILGHEGSALLVILNGMRLLRLRP